MRIESIEYYLLNAKLKTPFITNIRRVDAVEDLVVKIICDDGSIGYGEAPPTVAITGEDIPIMIETIQKKIFPSIKNSLVSEELLEVVQNSVQKSTSAKAAIDMAIYHLLSIQNQQPLFKYLGGENRVLQTDFTISLETPSKMLESVGKAIEDGFNILKVKLGEDKNNSIKIIKEIREHYPSVILRVDANQAWDERSTLEILDKIVQYNIELCEQPVKADDRVGLKNITKFSPIPILADESVFSYEDACQIIEEGIADYINIKLMKSGGIYQAKKIATIAQENNKKVMVGSMLESVISVSAGVHFALSLQSDTLIDLDGPVLAYPVGFNQNLHYDKDKISISNEVGLGFKNLDFSQFKRL